MFRMVIIVTILVGLDILKPQFLYFSPKGWDIFNFIGYMWVHDGPMNPSHA